LSMPRVRWAVGVVGAGALAALAVLLANRTTVLNALLSGHSGSGEVRTLVWLAAWHMIRDHLLLGIGPDQFLYYYSNLYTAHPYWILRLNGQRTLAWTEPSLAQPHNLILDLWLSGGILALVGFAAVLGAFWLGCWRVWRAARRSVSPLLVGDGSGAGSVPPVSRQPNPIGLQRTSHAPALQDRDSSPTPAPDVDSRDSAACAWRAAIALGLGASVLAGVLHGMVDSAYFEPDLALIFWWAMAALVLMASSPQ
jgi:O-antigen ligase